MNDGQERVYFVTATGKFSAIIERGAYEFNMDLTVGVLALAAPPNHDLAVLTGGWAQEWNYGLRLYN